MSWQAASLLLAAGRSQRMGGRNKLLERLGGEPLVARSARVLLRLEAGPVLAVLGFEAERVAAALAGLPVTLVHASTGASGQSASVRAGLAAAPAADAYIVAPADLPHLSQADCAALLAAHRADGGRRISVPVPAGGAADAVRGNPIVLPAALRDEILAGPKDFCCRRLTRERPDLVQSVQMAGDGCFLDLDTPEDLDRERARRAAAIWGEDQIDDRIAAAPLDRRTVPESGPT